MLNQLLNIATSAQWQEKTSASRCSNKVLSWLLDESSLTKKLEQQCNQFSVQVKLQVNTNTQQSPLSPHFTHAKAILVREVLLHCNNRATVFAQTEIPHSTLSNTQEKLINLGSESLGRVLFKDKTLQRGKIEIAEFTVGSPIHDFITSLQQTCKHSLWARRSLFHIGEKPLLVSEVFLPSSGIYN